MKHIKRSARPCLETLETRLAPAVTFRLFNGTLLVRGDNLGRDIQISRSAAGLEVSVDGGSPVLFKAANLSVVTGNGSDNVSLDWDDATPLPGSVTIQTGNGADTVSINSNNDFAFAPGTIRGHLTIVTGNGDDEVFLATDEGLTVLGNVAVQAGAGADQVIAVDGNDDPLRVGGGLTLVNFELVALVADPTLGFGVSVGRDLVLANVTGTQDNLLFFSAVEVGRNLSITDGAGCALTQLLDFSVAGNFVFQAGGGDNLFDLQAAILGVFVGGNLVYRGGAGDDLIDLEDNVLIAGNATLDVGGGDNAFANCDSAFVIGGNLLCLAGDGDNLFVDEFAGTVNGDLTIQFGNGDNAFFFDEGVLGGALRLRLGNGDNLVEIDGGGATLLLDFLFGSGTNDLTLDDGFFTGRIDGTTGTNTLTQTATAELAPNFVLIGF